MEIGKEAMERTGDPDAVSELANARSTTGPSSGTAKARKSSPPPNTPTAP